MLGDQRTQRRAVGRAEHVRAARTRSREADRADEPRDDRTGKLGGGEGEPGKRGESADNNRDDEHEPDPFDGRLTGLRSQAAMTLGTVAAHAPTLGPPGAAGARTK